MSAVPAQAHNAFTGSNPKNGARLTEPPETVTLSFLAKLDPSTTTVEVTSPGGVAATAGRPGVKGNKVSIGVRPGAAGEYTVSYQVASEDGHPIKGKIRFTVTSGAAASPAALPGATPSATTTAPTTPPPAATRTPAALVPVSDDNDGTPWWPWLLGVVVVIAAGAGALLIRRRPAR